ncbi:hypothetical protein WG66_007125 [Moniliophthora roreri]|nr:hypothetical protein WG66_007125 [Moniliophthora roreri]
MASRPFSLYDYITAFKSKKEYKATRLAQFLIQVLARDACLTKWEVSALCQDLVKARVHYDEIHTWIGIVDSEQHSESARWDAFEKYTDGLDDLERALFDLAVALDKEDELFIQLELHEDGDDFSDLAVVMELLEQVIEQSLRKQSLFSGSGFKRALRRIYFLARGWLFNLKSIAQDIKHTSMAKTLVYIEKMLEQMREWDQSDTTLNVAQVRIRIAFSRALHILAVLRLLKKKKDLTEDDWTYLEEKTKALSTDERFDKPGGDGWTYLMEVIQQIFEISLREPEPETKPDYKAKLPSYYPDMKRKAAEIRRPYFSQAVTVIRMCEALAKVLEGQANQEAAEKGIELAFQSVQAALIGATSATLGTQGIVCKKTTRVSELFMAARRSLQTCFTSFQMQDQWSKWEAKMGSATTRDVEHMELFEKRVEMHAEHGNPLSTELATIQLELVQKEAGTGRWQKYTSEILQCKFLSTPYLLDRFLMEIRRDFSFFHASNSVVYGGFA